MKRLGGEWSITENNLFLDMERMVHQHFRLKGGSHLRLECTFWDVDALALPAPAGWITGVFDHLGMERPLQLLRKRVIDAWINCHHPDLSELDDPELLVLPLSSFPAWLMASIDHPLAGVKGLGLADLERFPSLALPEGLSPIFERELKAQKLWNTPVRMSRFCSEDWEGRCADRVTMSFGNTVSQKLTPELVPLDWDLGIVGGQSLVVRRDLADQGPIQLLLELLHRRIEALQHQHPISIGPIDSTFAPFRGAPGSLPSCLRPMPSAPS
ncbi:MAG: LysR substrate-binding domain-containing protein [Prochlorococcaceae cyanobacterium]